MIRMVTFLIYSTLTVSSVILHSRSAQEQHEQEVAGSGLRQTLIRGVVRYEFTKFAIKDPSSRKLYSQALNEILFSPRSLRSANGLARLTSENMLFDFYMALFRVCDSPAWQDGNAFAAYEILLNDPHGSRLAEKAIRSNIKKKNIKRLDPILIIQLIGASDLSSIQTFKMLECSKEVGENFITLKLALAVWYAKNSSRGEADRLLKEYGIENKGESEAVALCEEVSKFIDNLPNNSADIVKWLERNIL